MLKKILVISFYIFSSLFVSYAENPLPALFKKNSSQKLKDLFTLNVGIMKLKNIGEIDKINPIDKKNIVDSIKNTLNSVPSVRVSRREAVLKAISVLQPSISDLKKKQYFTDLSTNLFYTSDKKSSSLIYKVFKEFKKLNNYNLIVKEWYENIENPIFLLNIGVPFSRTIKSQEQICKNIKSNNKGPLDILIYGEIERIEKLNIVTIFFYSDLLQKNIYEFSIVSESENLRRVISDKMKKIIPTIFQINYASLKIETNDPEVRIFLDSNYIGRESVNIDFLVPGNYVLRLDKEGYDDNIENVRLLDYEKKKLELVVEHKQEIQIVNFYIEPLGTKIYINSVFQGRTPFKKALPIGQYVVTAQNNFYEKKKYILSISAVKEEEMLVVFHLKTKDIFNFQKYFSKSKFEKIIMPKISSVDHRDFLKKMYVSQNYGFALKDTLTGKERLKLWEIFDSIDLSNNLFALKKTLYYAAFWNFTFSLVVMSPMLVFAYNAWEETSIIASAVTADTTLTNQERLDYVKQFKDTSDALYAGAAIILAYTGLSLVWLFYSLADYLLTFEKKDYLPIIEYYHNVEGDEGLVLGANIKL